MSVSPVRVYLQPARDNNPIEQCEPTQVAVADVARTNSPRHAAGVGKWLKGMTEWVGWWGVCMRYRWALLLGLRCDVNMNQ